MCLHAFNPGPLEKIEENQHYVCVVIQFLDFLKTVIMYGFSKLRGFSSMMCIHMSPPDCRPLAHTGKQRCWSESNQTVTDSAAPSHRPRPRKNTAPLDIAISSKWPLPSLLPIATRERMTPCLDAALLRLGVAVSCSNLCGGTPGMRRAPGARWGRAWRMLRLTHSPYFSWEKLVVKPSMNFPS